MEVAYANGEVYKTVEVELGDDNLPQEIGTNTHSEYSTKYIKDFDNDVFKFYSEKTYEDGEVRVKRYYPTTDLCAIINIEQCAGKPIPAIAHSNDIDFWVALGLFDGLEEGLWFDAVFKVNGLVQLELLATQFNLPQPIPASEQDSFNAKDNSWLCPVLSNVSHKQIGDDIISPKTLIIGSIKFEDGVAVMLKCYRFNYVSS